MTAASRSTPPPARLTIVYDDRCELCRRCRSWLLEQPTLVPLQFLPAGDPQVVGWIGERAPIGQELVVVADNGDTWVGPDAFIAVLAVLRRHRRLASTLQSGPMRPLARQVFHAVSLGRASISAVLDPSAPAHADGAAGRWDSTPDCAGETCSSPGGAHPVGPA